LIDRHLNITKIRKHNQKMKICNCRYFCLFSIFFWTNN